MRETVADIWPIVPGSERPPQDWPGWPGGKRFALVLTHDVEGAAGLTRCRELMKLEMELGFRSSFNFVPEGSYRVPAELREELTACGFEVGIHDLKHDGHLFDSHRGFKRRAVRINNYVHEWGASGFRSGFMLRNLDWLHDLDVKYDASTFDTDPFEPQPDGCHSVFPFWVPRSDCNFVGEQKSTINSYRRGYVELPYTLPQDSTLFLLLCENTIDIWRRKLDWIAEHGGMALLNTHPDYMAVDGSNPKHREYPIEFYRELLDYTRTRHSGEYWPALPREVAAHLLESAALSENHV